MFDPICEGKNMTRNCYLFCDIKKLFKDILERCYQRAYRDLTQLNKQQSQGNDYNEVGEKYREAFAKRNVFTDLLEDFGE